MRDTTTTTPTAITLEEWRARHDPRYGGDPNRRNETDTPMRTEQAAKDAVTSATFPAGDRFQIERRAMIPPEPEVCGTLAGYSRHWRAGEKPCPDCRAAKTEANRLRRGGDVCGTNAGHARHIRAGEPPCDACRTAHNRYQLRARARRRAARAKRSAA